MMKRPQNDPGMVQAALEGRPGAREALVDTWLPVVLGWCARLGGPRVDSEDAAHDVFIVVLNKLGSLQDCARFSAWLFGITRRVLARHRRQAWVRRWVPGLQLDVADGGPGPAKRYELSETSRRVQRALEQLPAAQREVLVLCDLEERTDNEAAQLLDIPLGTVKSRQRLGRRRFRILAERMELVAVPASQGGSR